MPHSETPADGSRPHLRRRIRAMFKRPVDSVTRHDTDDQDDDSKYDRLAFISPQLPIEVFSPDSPFSYPSVYGPERSSAASLQLPGRLTQLSGRLHGHNTAIFVHLHFSANSSGFDHITIQVDEVGQSADRLVPAEERTLTGYISGLDDTIDVEISYNLNFSRFNSLNSVSLRDRNASSTNGITFATNGIAGFRTQDQRTKKATALTTARGVSPTTKRLQDSHLRIANLLQFCTHIPDLGRARDYAFRNDDMIPSGLEREESSVYNVVLDLVAARRDAKIEPPHLVVITDLAKDIDDLAAMVLLCELHRLGAVVIEGFVANLDPPRERARFGRGALDALGYPHIPVAMGTPGIGKSNKQGHPVLDHEFAHCRFMAPESTRFESGQLLLTRLFRRAHDQGRKLQLLCLSSLTDAADAVVSAPQLFKENLSAVHLQGGHEISTAGQRFRMDVPSKKTKPEDEVWTEIKEAGRLLPHRNAANNCYDIEAADTFHNFLYDAKIPSRCWTKIVAYKTNVPASFFQTLKETGHKVGEHLYETQASQALIFYKSTLDEKTRFMSHMTQEWYLKNNTSWYQSHNPDELPTTLDAVIPYLNKVIAYDAFPALSAVGDDILYELGLMDPSTSALHSVFGTPATEHSPETTGVDCERLAVVVQALVKGALMWSQSAKETCEAVERARRESKVEI